MPCKPVSRLVYVDVYQPEDELDAFLLETVKKMKAEGYVLFRFDCYVKMRQVQAVFVAEKSL